ncbi:MAG: A24 family peptidase [Candidatus ainarchaeum sp.]|nr:A24 family peptidase [Candidatus ainarchaeum sp.]
MINIIQQAILFIGILLGGITDAKTGYIYDWITIPMIILGGIFSIMQFQLFNLFSGIIIFILLLITYKFGKIGGGDVKLFTGIALLNPFNKIDFLITLFFFSALIAMMFYSIYYTIKYYRLGINLKREKKGIFNAIIISIILIFYFIIMTTATIIKLNFVLLLILPLITGLIYFALQRGIKQEFFEQKIKVKDLEEDELIGETNNEIIKNILKGKSLIGEFEKQLLLKNKITNIIVLRNLPKFGPFIFIGTIIALFYPELILTLFL